MQKMDELIQQIRAELGSDFIAMDIVGMDGLSIASASVLPARDEGVTSARTAMVMKLADKVGDKLGLGAVEDNLVTTDKVYILFRYLGDKSYIWGLTLRRDAILGAARMVMKDFMQPLWDAIPHD